MKIHAICVVKNEADIIVQSLPHAADWCDNIYVLDNGSEDGTWESVQELAQKHPQIVPYKQDHGVFKDAIRREVWQHYASHAQPGDWWCRLDADEFYPEDPRTLLTQVPARCDVVWSVMHNFFFTDRDLLEYETDPQAFLARPVIESLRYYLSNWAEPRFLRHRPDYFWRKSLDWPSLLTAYPDRYVSMCHYRYRNPPQIMNRIGTRRKNALRGGTPFVHENAGAFEDFNLRPSETVAAHVKGHSFIMPEDADLTRLEDDEWRERVLKAEDLTYWAPGAALENDLTLVPAIPTSSRTKRALRQFLRPFLTPVAEYC